jgi:hypothetical protein
MSNDMDYKPTALMIAWEKALREEGRQQTTSYLGVRQVDGTVANCCLGVLMEVHGFEAVDRKEWAGDNVLKYGDAVSLPPTNVMSDLLGYDFLDNDLPLGVRADLGSPVSAASLNDGHNWTFIEIADQVRKVYIEGSGDPTDYKIEGI